VGELVIRPSGSPDLCTLLRQARLAHGFTQRQLAKILDVPDAYASKWEREFSLPSWEMLAKLCEALDIEPGEAFLARTAAAAARRATMGRAPAAPRGR